MNRDHAVIEELLAVRSLGGLDGDDLEALERELSSHGDCLECRQLQDEFDETAGRLAFALDPQPVDPAMVDRILSDGRQVRQIGPTGTWRRFIAMAASFVVLIAGFTVLRSNTTTVSVVAAQRFVVLEGDEGDLALAYTPGQAGIVVWGRDLPEPGAGSVYELWAISGETPVSQGCMEPTNGNLATFLDTEIGTADVMAVTVESTSCPDAPTTQPVYVGELV